MLTYELKCIETLLKKIYNNESIRRNISKNFESTLEFEITKTNLLNLLSINTLLSNYTTNPPFNLERFIIDGTIPNVYTSPIKGPTFDSRYNNAEDFINAIVEAIKNGEYVFDEESNVYVSNEKIETILTTEWFYRFSHSYIKTRYQRIYLFNKNIENDITDEESLDNYLHHTKTFITELTTDKDDKNYEETFKIAESRTNEKLKKKSEISVDDVIKEFKTNVSSKYNVNIIKYKLSSNVYIIKRANQMGQEFYKKPLKEQKELINKWMIEFINSNDLDNDLTQEFLILTNSKNDFELPSHIDTNRVVVSLFSLYLNLLKDLNIDFDTISLSDFKIKTFITNNEQKNLIRLNSTIKEINRLNNGILYNGLSDRINDVISEISILDQIEDSDKLSDKTDELDYLKQEHKKINDRITLLQQERNTLQNVIRHNQRSELEDLAFDNNRIYRLIKKCTEHGHIYISPLDKSKIVLDLYSAELGKAVFKVEISKDKILPFIENNNSLLEEKQTHRWG